MNLLKAAMPFLASTLQRTMSTLSVGFVRWKGVSRPPTHGFKEKMITRLSTSHKHAKPMPASLHSSCEEHRHLEPGNC
jgi:hypothetical protein